METQVPPKCPYCSRLTVDNDQHCPTMKPARWLTHCATMVCKCGAVYRSDVQFRSEGRLR